MKNCTSPVDLLKIVFISCFFWSGFGYSQVTDWTKNWDSYVNIQKHQFKPGFGHVLVGRFIDTVDFDLGPSVQNSISANNAFFILKLDTAGAFEWVKTMESDTIDPNMKIGDLKINALNEIYFMGIAYSVDLDPSANVAQVTTLTWQTPSFLVKYSSVGDFLWHQTVNLPYTENTLELDNSGNALVLAYDYAGAINISVGSDVVTTIGQSNESVIAKYSNSGVGLWVKKIRSNSPSNPYNYAKARTMTIATDGSVYIAGEFKDSIDFDPSPSSDFYLFGFPPATTLNYNSFFLLKLDMNGAFVFAKKQNDSYDTGISIDISLKSTGEIYVMGKTTLDSTWNQSYNFIKLYNSYGDSIWTKYVEGNNVNFNQMILDASDNIYITGNFDVGSFSFDPLNLTSTISQPFSATISGFLVRYDSFGNFIWFNQEFDSLNGPANGETKFTNVSLDSLGTIYVLNSPYTGTTGLLKVTQDSCTLSFQIVVGFVQHITCTQSGQILITTFGGGSGIIDYLWSTGDTGNQIFPGAPGVYSVIATSQNGCSDILSVLINGPLQGASHDLNASLWGSALIPGQIAPFSFNVKNMNCSPVSGTAYLVLDTLSTFISATTTPSSISGDTLFWNFTNMIYDSNELIVHLSLMTDTLATIGTITHFKLNASPFLNDLDTTNNEMLYDGVVVTSYDPNDIAVYPSKCNEGFVAPDQTLKYTIRFQNTGTAQAYNISILDTLDADLYSIRIIASSHHMYTLKYPNNVVKFVFPNINLADSNSNEPASHGYLIFEADPQIGLVNGTQIENRVGIYFDYNSPIYTNTVFSTIFTGDMSAVPCLLSLEEMEETVTFALFPNPANDRLYMSESEYFEENTAVQITDMEGRIVLETKYQQGEAFDISGLKSGLYFLRIESEKGWVAKRFVKL